MCDYDNDCDFQELRRGDVVTRKPQQCGSCLKKFPAGTRMGRVVGKWDGTLGSVYSCRACDWALGQPDHTTLHLCWGWNWGDDYEDGGTGEDRWKYINDELTAGRTPTPDGFKALLTVDE
jgi:hypothetical protein